MYAVQAYCGSSNKNSLFSIGASSFGTNKQGQITAYGEASINIGKAMVSAIEIKQSFGFSIGGITVEVG
ncbi:hypothetical protein [Caldicellulosiruptor naganoensis]|uniref:Uncharacterized protein n=1 Tax=Caldicellulosiruptor naganoensis TaxID=29324 RepID=A0ABY7BFS2_9FIRM|nr:hypothetical protein [Caldicellulosiruptor naganoensis]WAM31207.1 hypothetical protein OTJ99_002037 [Caldicellulosiruptor naganoensis]